MLTTYPATMISSLMSGSAARRKLQILIFHRVLPCLDPFQPSEVTVADFDWQMQLVSQYFNVLPLADAVARLYTHQLPPRALCVTFDDGYRDNIELALPVLKRHGVNATFFIASGFTGEGVMFCDVIRECLQHTTLQRLDADFLGLERQLSLATHVDRLAAIGTVNNRVKYTPLGQRQDWLDLLEARTGITAPRNLMMREDELRALAAAGMGVGGHTVQHPILSCEVAAVARDQITDNRRHLEQMLQQPVTLFAYPNGKPGSDYTDEHKVLLRKEGFAAAVSTGHGVSTPTTDPFELRRFTPWDKTPLRFWARLQQNYLDRH